MSEKESMDVHGQMHAYEQSDNPERDLWNKRGSEGKEDLPDQNQKALEMELVLRHAPHGLDILDIGCGNGRMTAALAEHAKSATGLDIADQILEKARASFGAKVDFQVGDVTSLQFPDASFDLVLTQRCLINLRTYERQLQALAEIRRVLRPGGLLLLLETTTDGIRELSEARQRFGLSEIPVPWHNLPMDMGRVLADCESSFTLKEKVSFGTYFLLTRILHPLLVAPEQPRYDARINEIARSLALEFPSFNGLMDQVALYILTAR